MRIASVNAWGGALADDLLTWLSADPAQVVCLQEVTRTPGLTGWTTFDDGDRSLPQRADLLADVRAALPRHQAIFVAGDSGPVHDASGRRHRQDFGLATLVRRLDGLVVVCGDFNLLPGSETFDVLASAGLTDLVGDADTRTSHYRKPVRHASYLLVSDLTAVKSFTVLDAPEVSDHRALILDLETSTAARPPVS